MSQLTELQSNILSVLAICKRSLRVAILEKVDKNVIAIICEYCLNLLLGNVEISKEILSKLSRYKHIFRKLIKKSSIKTKKKLLIRHSEFLTFLIPVIKNEIRTESDGDT